MSYAHDDDLKLSTKELGFVTFLNRQLSLKLRDLGAQQIKIWRDLRRISRMHQFDNNDIIDDGLVNADFLLVVMSPRWIVRPYCRKELDAFIALRKAAGVADPATRMLLIGKGYVDRSARPQELQGQGGFLFYSPDVENNPRMITPFFDHGKCADGFYRVLDDLAVDLQRRVNRIIVSAPAPAEGGPNGETDTMLTQFRPPNAKRRRPARTRFYVSYAWADLADPNREADVDRLCNEAIKRGIEVIRDKSALKNGDLISKFMQRLGGGDRIFIFLSDKYLKSPYCMFELFEMWCNCGQKSHEFRRRVRFITIDGANIGTPDNWLSYSRFWKNERELLRRDIDNVGWEDAGQEVQRRYDQIKTFAGKVADVLALFADTVQPRTFDEFVTYGFDDLSGRLEPGANLQRS